VEVHDSGIGIPADRIETMFEPFTQADASITRRFGGTGLGLTISRRFARAMGGDIVASSLAGAGSTLTLTFAAGDLRHAHMLTPAQVMAEQGESASVLRQQWQIPSSRVLVVDDGAENRELLSLVLAEQGLWVDEAENGQVALDRVQAGSYDLILMDMQMPVLDGFRATAILRERGVTTPIVALTANAMKGFEQEVLQAGCTAYVTKPVDIDVLLERIAGLLGGERVMAQANEPVSQAPGRDAPLPEFPPQRQSEPEPELLPELGVIDMTPIRSRLASNARFAPIVRKFAARLEDQLAEAEAAWQREDSAEIARFAHWLAGAAGTVGYDAFTAPARELEAFAVQQDVAGVSRGMAQLRQMSSRVEQPLEPVGQT
jgi:CheY-like chemotaxis protein/HPt (histidine-containing phosphotransfer) domain-containing protein